MSYLNTPWYAKQLRQLTTPCPPGVSEDDDPTRILCQRRFRPELAPAFYSTHPPAPLPSDRTGEPIYPPAGGVQAPTRSIFAHSGGEIYELTVLLKSNPYTF